MILHRMRTISGGVLIFEAQTILKMPLPTYIKREHEPICPPPPDSLVTLLYISASVHISSPSNCAHNFKSFQPWHN